jgi:hypothetical protein
MGNRLSEDVRGISDGLSALWACPQLQWLLSEKTWPR